MRTGFPPQSLFLAIAAAAFAPSVAAADGATPPAEPAVHREPEPRPWTQKQFLLGTLRWWVDPDVVERLRGLGPGDADVRVRWAAPAASDAAVTDDERDLLQRELREALLAAVGAEAGGRGRIGATDGVPAGATTTAPRLAIDIDARVIEVWRPRRLLNVVIVALPGPGAPFVTQGGAATEVDVVDAGSGRVVAGFECRSYAGVARFLEAFGRIGHARGALRDCAETFVAALRAGRLPETTLALTPGGAASSAGTSLSAPAGADPAYAN